MSALIEKIGSVVGVMTNDEGVLAVDKILKKVRGMLWMVHSIHVRVMKPDIRILTQYNNAPFGIMSFDRGNNSSAEKIFGWLAGAFKQDK
jgi:hypothetical protein